MENLITLRQCEAEFFGGMDYAARRAAVEAAHAEALKNNAAYDAQIAFECKTKPFQQKMVEWAHAEALEMDKQATHFRKVQTALSRRVAVIMGKTPA
ncbi:MULTISPECIES: hypothetical protein [unclassified Pantoea]|uniref:hypothetical protein n=1 Tax=unclassified Pantoea TaxID=2630326 RepID=UPI002064B328|nr:MULTISPECIES: hypothetical protein [unclassified Pantoea]MDU5473987.1 hypothetical protein [Pantoea sp.]DAI70410.1 MAG TPA: hypothetical protein [Bacteriophage sp.]